MALSLAEVMQRTGLPASTIHHYRRAGLLPPLVAGSGRCTYGPGHVEALGHIRRLRGEHGLSLQHIAALLPGLLDGGAAAEEACGAATSRRRALDAATRRFGACSYSEVTMADVAADAGMAKGSLYRCFASKEELFTAVVEDLLARTSADFAALVGEAPAAEAFAGVVVRSMPVLLELGARAAKGHEPSQALARRVLATLASAAGRPLAADGEDPTETGLLLIERAFAVVLRWSLAGRSGA